MIFSLVRLKKHSGSLRWVTMAEEPAYFPSVEAAHHGLAENADKASELALLTLRKTGSERPVITWLRGGQASKT